MKRNKSILGLAAIFTAALMLWITATDVSAQGRYVGQYSRGQVDDIIRRLEDSGDDFRDNFNNELNRSNLSNSQKNTYRRQVETFENATDRLRRNFDSQDDWWSSRSQVQNVVADSRPLNITMNAIGFRRNIERQWNQLRNNVNTLADTYDLPGIAGGGWNGGGGGGTGVGRRPPSWAQGTFYARNPQTGGTIQMTVDRDGQVTLVQDGYTTTYASMSGTLLTNGPYQSRVSRINDGIRTTSTTSNERRDYYRTQPGSDGGGVGGNVPNWAEGTFYARNPQTGGTIQMTIQNDGQVILVQDGTTTTYASLNGTILTNGPYQSRISRTNNGIRTTSTTNSRDRIDYTRNRSW